MKIGKALLALAIVIVLAIVVFYKVYRSDITRKARETQERHLIRFNMDTIKSFTLVRPDSSIVFERGIGRIWNIVEPIKTEADKEPIYQLFYTLDNSDILLTVEENPEDLSPYGLDNSKYYMTMEYDNGDTDTLFVGLNTPDQTNSYVKFAAENRVIAVTSILTDLLKRPILSYRSRTIANVLYDDIIGIDIYRRDPEIHDIKLYFNNVVWMMKEPWDYLVDKKNIDLLVKDIAEAGKRNLIEEHASDLSQYGLDDPSIVLSVKLKFDMPDKMIVIGDRLKERGKTHLRYAKQFDNDLVFTTDNRLVTKTERDPEWFIDKQPVKFNRELVNKIVINTTTDDPFIFLKNAAGSWSTVSPVDKNVDQNVISSIYGISRFLLINKVVSFNSTPEDLVNTGLDHPNSTITFLNGSDVLTTVNYGNTFMTDLPNTYIQTSLMPLIFITNARVGSTLNSLFNQIYSN